VTSVREKCAKALAWLGVEGAKGPMGPFDRAVAVVHQGLTDS